MIRIPFHLLLISSNDVTFCSCGSVDHCPLLCVFEHYRNIWPIVLQLLVSAKTPVPSYPHLSMLCKWQGLMVIPLVGALYPLYFLHIPTAV